MPIEFPDGTTIPTVEELQADKGYRELDDAGKLKAQQRYLQHTNELGRANFPNWTPEKVQGVAARFTQDTPATGMGITGALNPLAMTDVGRRISEGALNQAEASRAMLRLRDVGTMPPEELAARMGSTMPADARQQVVGDYAGERQAAIEGLAQAVEAQQSADPLIEQGEVFTLKGFVPAIAKTTAQSLLAMSAGSAMAPSGFDGPFKKRGAVGAAAPILNPFAGMAAGYEQELPSSIIELVQEAGYDLTNPADIERLLSDPEARKDMEDAEKRAGIRAGVIAMIDGVAQIFGAKGAVKAGKKAATDRGRAGIEAGVEMGADVIGGGGGEVAARAAIGQEQSAEETVLEAGGGLSQAPASLVNVASRNAGKLDRAEARKSLEGKGGSRSVFSALTDRLGMAPETTDKQARDFAETIAQGEKLMEEAQALGVAPKVARLWMQGDTVGAGKVVDDAKAEKDARDRIPPAQVRKPEAPRAPEFYEQGEPGTTPADPPATPEMEQDLRRELTEAGVGMYEGGIDPDSEQGQEILRFHAYNYLQNKYGDPIDIGPLPPPKPQEPTDQDRAQEQQARAQAAFDRARMVDSALQGLRSDRSATELPAGAPRRAITDAPTDRPTSEYAAPFAGQQEPAQDSPRTGQISPARQREQFVADQEQAKAKAEQEAAQKRQQGLQSLQEAQLPNQEQIQQEQQAYVESLEAERKKRAAMATRKRERAAKKAAEKDLKNRLVQEDWWKSVPEADREMVMQQITGNLPLVRQTDPMAEPRSRVEAEQGQQEFDRQRGIEAEAGPVQDVGPQAQARRPKRREQIGKYKSRRSGRNITISSPDGTKKTVQVPEGWQMPESYDLREALSQLPENRANETQATRQYRDQLTGEVQWIGVNKEGEVVGMGEKGSISDYRSDSGKVRRHTPSKQDAIVIWEKTQDQPTVKPEQKPAPKPEAPKPAKQIDRKVKLPDGRVAEIGKISDEFGETYYLANSKELGANVAGVTEDVTLGQTFTEAKETLRIMLENKELGEKQAATDPAQTQAELDLSTDLPTKELRKAGFEVRERKKSRATREKEAAQVDPEQERLGKVADRALAKAERAGLRGEEKNAAVLSAIREEMRKQATQPELPTQPEAPTPRKPSRMTRKATQKAMRDSIPGEYKKRGQYSYEVTIGDQDISKAMPWSEAMKVVKPGDEISIHISEKERTGEGRDYVWSLVDTVDTVIGEKQAPAEAPTPRKPKRRKTGMRQETFDKQATKLVDEIEALDRQIEEGDYMRWDRGGNRIKDASKIPPAMRKMLKSRESKHAALEKLARENPAVALNAPERVDLALGEDIMEELGELMSRMEGDKPKRRKKDWSTSKGKDFDLDGNWIVQLPDGNTVSIGYDPGLGPHASGWYFGEEAGENYSGFADNKKEALAILKQKFEDGTLADFRAKRIAKKTTPRKPKRRNFPDGPPKRKGQRGGIRPGKKAPKAEPSMASVLGGEYTDADRQASNKATWAETFTALGGDVKESAKHPRKFLSFVFEPVKNRLRRIDSNVYAKIMRSAFVAQSKTQAMMERVEPFLVAAGSIPDAGDRRAFRRAQISGDSAAIRFAAEKYGFMDQYLEARSVIDQLMETSQGVGLEVDDVTTLWKGGRTLTDAENAYKDTLVPSERAAYMRARGYTLVSANDMRPGGKAQGKWGASQLAVKQDSAKQGLTEYEYWPRSLVDYNQMRKDLGLSEVTQLEKAIKNENERRAKAAEDARYRLETLSKDQMFQNLTKRERQKKMEAIGGELGLETGKPMTEQEEQVFVARYVSGMDDRNQASLASNNFFAKRQFKSVSLKQADYYEDPSVAMVNLIRRVNDTAEKRRALGLTEDFDSTTIAIGARVNDMLKDGDITNDEVEAVKGILTAYYNNTSVPSGAKIYKNLENLANIANTVSSALQLADVLFTLWRYGLRMPIGTTRAIAKAIVGKGDVSLIDVGAESKMLNDIINSAPELRSQQKTIRKISKGSENLTDLAFKWSGFRALDRIGKQSLLNAAFHEASKQAKKGTDGKFDAQVSSLLKDGFSAEERGEVVNDLRAGVMSDNVRYLMFLQLSEIQPISPLNMPERYLAGGALTKMSYQFLSFTMNRWGLLAQTAMDKNRSKSERSMATLGLVFAGMASEVPAFLLQQVMLGRIRPDEEEWMSEELDELIISGILRSLGFSRFFTNSMAKGDWVTGISALFPVLPPMRVGETVIKDLFSAVDIALTDDEFDWKRFKTIKALPVGGRLADGWFGAGAEKAADARENIAYAPQVNWLGEPIRYGTVKTGAGRVVSSFWNTMTGMRRGDQYGVPPKNRVKRSGRLAEVSSEQWDRYLRAVGEETNKRLRRRGLPLEWNEETHEVYKQAAEYARRKLIRELPRQKRSRRPRRRSTR